MGNGYIYPQNQSKWTFCVVEMTPERLLNMRIEGLYLPQKILYHPKQISGYAPVAYLPHFCQQSWEMPWYSASNFTMFHLCEEGEFAADPMNSGSIIFL